MTHITIEKKSYVLLPEKEYQTLQRKAAMKTKPEKLFTISQGRSYSKAQLKKWAEGK